jgi:hypothetical protein
LYWDNERYMPMVSGDALLRERLEKALAEAAPGFVRAVVKAKEDRADYAHPAVTRINY